MQRVCRGSGLRYATVWLAIYFIFSHSAEAQEKGDWTTEWQRAVAGAEKEGEVIFYTLGDDHSYLKGFEKQFPKIKIRLVPGKGSDLLSRLMAERRGGKYLADVARIGNTSLRIDISQDGRKSGDEAERGRPLYRYAEAGMDGDGADPEGRESGAGEINGVLELWVKIHYSNTPSLQFWNRSTYADTTGK